MPKVLIELDILKGWVDKLDRNQYENVAEEMFDEIKRIEYATKTAQEELDQLKRDREKAIDEAVNAEPPLHMKTVMLGNHYRFRSDVNFKKPHDELKLAEVIILSKGRTKVDIKVVEPGNRFFNKTFSKIDLSTLTSI